jgi:hypothetical protein
MDDIEQRIADIYRRMKPLQEEFGVKSMTLEERQIYNNEQKKIKEDLAKLTPRRPVPKWKV